MQKMVSTIINRQKMSKILFSMRSKIYMKRSPLLKGINVLLLLSGIIRMMDRTFQQKSTKLLTILKGIEKLGDSIFHSMLRTLPENSKGFVKEPSLFNIFVKILNLFNLPSFSSTLFLIQGKQKKRAQHFRYPKGWIKWCQREWGKKWCEGKWSQEW